MTDLVDFEIITGVGNEVFYFFVFVILLVLVVLAWYSTHVVEPVVQSVILVERSPVSGSLTGQATSPEEVREAVSQFLQQQPEEDDEGIWNERTEQEDEEEDRAVTEVLEDLPAEERVTIRLKFLNDTQKDVEASLVENIGQFKRRNFTEEIGSNKNVRLIFNGQVLRDESSSLRNCGLFDKCVVHCLVSTLPAPSNSGHPAPVHGGRGQEGGDLHGGHHHLHQPQLQGQALDVSALFIPILGLALAMVWYLALTYNSYFNFMSTTCLLGLTSLYFLSVYGTHFHVNVAVRTGGGPQQPDGRS